MYEPSEEEVRSAFTSIRLANPELGLVKVTERIRNANPTWTLSHKRARAIHKSGGVSIQISNATTSPMGVLLDFLHRLVAGGDSKSSKRVAQLQMPLNPAAMFGTHVTPDEPRAFVQQNFSVFAGNYPMKSCLLVSTIILQISAPNHLIASCHLWNSKSWSGRPTSELISRTPSTPLFPSYDTAKALAVTQGQSSVIAGNIVDVEMMDRGAGVKVGSCDHMSFAHSFILVVGPEGVRVIQAWGKHGYSLGENIASDASRLRCWEEAEKFVADYDQLCGLKGRWSRVPSINRLYKKCFGIDVLHLTGPMGSETRTIVPIFRSWSRVKVIEDVKFQDVSRWLKILDAVDEFLDLN